VNPANQQERIALAKQDTQSCELLHQAIAKKTVKPSDVRACFKSFPYNEKDAAGTIDSLRKFMQLYVFLDYYGEYMKKWPFSPNALTEKQFATDFDFQEAIFDELVTWYDGHLDYRPNCYRMFQFQQPLFVTPVVDTYHDTRFLIYGLDANAPPELKKYIGYELIHINGKPALEVIKAYAHAHYGVFRSSRTRLARALATPYFDSATGKFLTDKGFFFKRSRVPQRNDMTFTVRNHDSDKTEPSPFRGVCATSAQTM
jgi:hypothetical protein